MNAYICKERHDMKSKSRTTSASTITFLCMQLKRNNPFVCNKLLEKQQEQDEENIMMSVGGIEIVWFAFSSVTTNITGLKEERLGHQFILPHDCFCNWFDRMKQKEKENDGRMDEGIEQKLQKKMMNLLGAKTQVRFLHFSLCYFFYVALLSCLNCLTYSLVCMSVLVMMMLYCIQFWRKGNAQLNSHNHSFLNNNSNRTRHEEKKLFTSFSFKGHEEKKEEGREKKAFLHRTKMRKWNRQGNKGSH